MKSIQLNKQLLSIIYEDNDILAINKPAGFLVHPVKSSSAKNAKDKQKTLTSFLLKKYPKIKKVGDEPDIRPGIVHRLDKDTSGVLLVAKNQEAFEYLKNCFKERKINKKYTTLVVGEMKNDKGVIDLPIGKSKKDFRKKSSQGKLAGKIREAITKYEVLERFQDYTLAAVYPKTGRTHQVRVHFKAIGHPLVCDKLYGFKKAGLEARCPFGLKRHFLHAASLEFVLPSGARIKLEADLPEDLQNALKMLREQK